MSLKKASSMIMAFMILLQLLGLNGSFAVKAFAEDSGPNVRPYAIKNGSFEQLTNDKPNDWSYYNSHSSVISSTYAAEGERSVQLSNDPSLNGFTSSWQVLNVGEAEDQPHAGDAVQAQMMLYIPASIDLSRGQVYMQVDSVDASQLKTVIAKSPVLTNADKGTWKLIQTQPVGDGRVLSGAVTVVISIQDYVQGDITYDSLSMGADLDAPPPDQGGGSDPAEPWTGRTYQGTNFGFEQFAEGAAWPTGWDHYTTNANDAGAELDSVVTRDGPSLKLTNQSGKFTAMWQVIPVGTGPNAPHNGDAVEAGVWMYIPSTAILNSGIYLQIDSTVGGAQESKKTLAKSGDLSTLPMDCWVWVQTNPINGGIIADDVTEIVVSFQNYMSGTINIDSLMMGTADTLPDIGRRFSVRNGSFETFKDGWATEWPHDGSATAVQDEDAHDQSVSMSVYNPSGHSSMWQSIGVGQGADNPHAGDFIEAGMWINLSSDLDLDVGTNYLQVVATVAGTKVELARSGDLSELPRDTWVWVKTLPINGGLIPNGANFVVPALQMDAVGGFKIDSVQLGASNYLPEQYQTGGELTPNGAKKNFTVINNSFEALNGKWPDFWAQDGTVQIQADPDAYYGKTAMKVTNNGASSVFYQNLPIVSAETSAQPGDTVQAGVWMKIPAGTTFTEEQLSVVVESKEKNGTRRLLAQTGDLTNLPRDTWTWVTTEAVNGGIVDSNHGSLILSIKNSITGELYFDYVQVGTIGNFNGNPDKLALMDYQPWFGTGADDWQHWKYEDAAVQHNPENLLPNGQRDIAATRYPLIGAYDSKNVNVLNYHVDLAKAMNVDAFLVDYYGDMVPEYKASFESLLQIAEQKDLKIGVLYEPKIHMLNWVPHNSREEQIAAITDDIKNVFVRYGTSKALLKYNGKVVISVFQAAYNGLTSADWDKIKADLNAEGYDPYLVLDGVPTDASASSFSAFGGAFNWTLYNSQIADGGYDAAKAFSAQINQSTIDWAATEDTDRLAIGMVWPGFDDSSVNGWGGGARAIADDGSLGFYKGTYDGVKDKPFNWLLFGTFNDWNESTAVEPSKEEGNAKALETRTMIQQFKGITPFDDGSVKSASDSYFSAIAPTYANAQPANDTVGGGSADVSLSVQDPQGSAMDVTFYPASTVDMSDSDSEAFDNASGAAVEPPKTMVVDGEVPFTDEAKQQVTAEDGVYFTTDSTEGFPYQRYSMKIKDDLTHVKEVDVNWKGHSLPDRIVSVYAWDHVANKWVKIGSGKGAEDFAIKGKIDVASMVQDQTVEILVQDLIPEPSQYDFTIAWETDTQYMSQSWPQLYDQMNKWIVGSDGAQQKIQYVVHSGDIVQDWNAVNQWENADKAMKNFEDVGMPYGVLPGNHDNNWGPNHEYYYQYFGENRFKNQDYFGGSFNNNEDHFDLFSAGGADFMALYLGYSIDTQEFDWAKKALEEHSDRNTIIVLHEYIDQNGAYSGQGAEVRKQLVEPYKNVFMVLSGHISGASYNEKVINGRKVTEILHDYQDEPKGGNGYMRLLHFDMANKKLYVNSYSPVTNDYNYYPADKDEFSTDLDFLPSTKEVSTDYIRLEVRSNESIGSAAGVASGAQASAQWQGLNADSTYKWYAEIKNEVEGSTLTDLYTFTTGSGSGTGPREITLSETNKRLPITSEDAAGEPITVNVPAGVSDATIDAGQLLNEPSDGKVATGELPALNIDAVTSISTTPVSVKIPQGTTITAPESGNWNGTIRLPQAQAANSVTVAADAGKTATVNAVVEVGFGNVPLTLSKAARIVLPGMAGKDVGYARGTTFTKITGTITADTQAAADAQIAAGGDAAIDVGADKVIWTKHFTKFVAYTQTANQPSDPGTVNPGPSDPGTADPGSGDTGSGDGTDTGTGTGNDSGTGSGQTGTVDLTDIAGHWAYEQIKKLVELGVVSGYPDGTFKPDSSITRAEFVKFLVTALKLEPMTGKVFADTGSHWAKDYIATANAYGIIGGYSDTAFGPNDPITREQMAVMVVHAAKLAEVDDEVTFTDRAALSPWAAGAVRAALKYGIINGYPDNSFKPAGHATRAEAVKVIVQVIESIDQK